MDSKERFGRICPICHGFLDSNGPNELKCLKCEERFQYQENHKVWKNDKIVDIAYLDPETSVLSNLFPRIISIDGIKYHSLEAFFRGLCWNGSQSVLENEIAILSGMNAWRVRYALPDWRQKQIVYYSGKEIPRESDEYQRLLEHAYDCVFEQSAVFQNALQKTQGKILMHTLGNHNPRETLLTEQEYMNMLRRERDRL